MSNIITIINNKINIINKINISAICILHAMSDILEHSKHSLH